MADTISITLPEIAAVSVAPNPVPAGAQYTVTVTVTEKTVILSPVWYESGEVYAGEE